MEKRIGESREKAEGEEGRQGKGGEEVRVELERQI